MCEDAEHAKVGDFVLYIELGVYDASWHERKHLECGELELVTVPAAVYLPGEKATQLPETIIV